jgi:hypothetical protein
VEGGDGNEGVGVMVKKELVELVCEVRCKSDRVIMFVMWIGNVTVRVISAYAPQKGQCDKEKDKFYEKLDDEMTSTPDTTRHPPNSF